MKTRIWALGLVLMMALLVGASATTAEAATFSFTFNGCDGDTVCVVPVTGSTPDSIQWFYSNGLYGVTDLVPPFDTCFIWNGAASGRDSLVMHAWFVAADSMAARPVLVDYMIAMGDGRDVDENGTVGVEVLMNDTTSTPDSVYTLAEVLGNIADNGTVDSIINDIIWYTPNPGYNGTDDFAYSAENECGTSDTAVVSLTILSDGLLAFDTCWYDWIDVPCACDDSADGLGTISVGDSLRVCALLEAWDLDELTTPGWPRVDMPGLGGLNQVMVQDTSADLGMLDTALFCWPGRVIDSANTWFVVTDENLDVAAGFYEIIVEARSNEAPFMISACTTIVEEAIDNNGPDEPDEATWTLWHDVNGDGIATTVDSMRFFVDLRNEPFEEICQVCVTTYGFPYELDTSAAGGFSGCLYEIAGDNRWGLVFEVPPGDLENNDGPFTAVIRYTDNACNVDSVTVTYNGPVDNTAPICANITWDFEFGDDLDSNNCISLGETVHIEICDTNSGNNDVTYWLSVYSDTLWRFGLGSQTEGDVSHDSIPFTLSGDCGELDWTLGMFPLENAIDTTTMAGAHPWVYLFAVDDAGNPFVCDSLQIIWDDPNPNHDEIDARPPQPMVLDACIEDTTFLGTRAVRIRFSDTSTINGPGFGDIARFRMFYDNGTGVIDYADTLAGLSWDDVVGQGGTDGLTIIDANTIEWTTDGTVELSWCRDYLFNIWVMDSCGNVEYLHPDSILCEGTDPAPTDWVDCSSEDDLNICLEWQTSDASVDSFCIFMASDGAYDTAVWVATVQFSGDTADTFSWCTDDAGLELIEFRWYDFIVLSYDSCGNVQEEEPADEFIGDFIAQCLADVAPPVVCVFQPATLSPEEDTTLYSCDRCTEFIGGDAANGMWIYTRPCNDTSLDVRSIDSVLIRLADSAGEFGEWHYAGFSAQEGPNHWAILIDCESLDLLAREDDSVEVIQVMVISTDAAGRQSTRDQVEDCCGFFEFKWSAWYVDLVVQTVDDKVQTYQPYCNAHGFDVSGGGTHEVEICIEAGTPPYKIRMATAPSGDGYADEYYDQVLYVENVYATCTTLTFSTEGWRKGLGELDVEVCDAGGHYSDEHEIALCVDDEIPPCALIVNPVDGKCIRRSLSMIDPVEVCIEIDPAGTSLDPENVLKIDYQWSQDCCVGFVVDTICFDTACPPPVGFPEGSICTTYANPNSAFFGQTFCHPLEGGGNPVACTVYADGANGLDSTICWEAQADTTCRITVCRLREVPCETVFEWKTFAIQPGNDLEGDLGCVDWWNTEDLAWVTESGTIIYLRAIVYDEQGNTCITPCVQICVDIDTPPLCLWTPDVCPSNGYMAIGGNEDHEVTFVAELDLAQGNVDDLEDVQLWYKKSTDPDVLDYWCNIGSGFFGEFSQPGGTNSTVWRWDIDLDNSYDCLGFQDGISYDFRVIGHTIWGTYSWDYNGDSEFDANTFDSSECDMSTFYIDKTAPQVAMDTVWTTVNGEQIVQPNVSCAMSDPRGWAWTQFGNEMTIQPNVYPWTGQGPEYLNFRDDVKRVRWTLYDDSHDCECGADQRGEGPYPSGSCFDDECDCVKGEGQDYCDYDGSSTKSFSGVDPWVIADLQGANPMQNLTFNPANAPWWDDNWTGVQTAVLLVEVWDSCGNRTQDCITLYLLDADPTDAIIVEPMNDQVFCTAPGGDAYGGIDIRSGSILEEGWNKAVYAYRAVGSTEWIEFDSVGISQDGDYTWQKGWTEVTWNPVAMGLPNGSYELTVWAVDNALNRSTNLYIVTVHLSCSAPTVALVYPTSTDPAFIGCPIQLEAIATSSDPVNPVVEVEFYYVSVIEALDEATYIGSDYNSVDGRWGFYWDEPNFEGPYYIYAIAYNLSGQSSMSELVWVKGDNTSPWAEITQVGDDITNSDDDDSGPTQIPYGSTVTLYGNAYDNQADWGYGEVDNCGVDSVIFYVYDDGEVVAGFLATPDDIIDSMFTAEWTVTGDLFQAGEYSIRMEVWDCACNSGSSDYWDVEITSPEQNPTISVDGPVICGYTTVDGTLDVTVSVNNPDFVDEVWVAYSNTIYSDVEDQYEWFELNNNYDGTYSGSTYVGETEEGIYRVRAVVYYEDNTSTENGFDDFTFNDEFEHHTLVRFDHSVAPFTLSPVGGTTFKAHDDICFSIDADDECDIDHVHVCSGDEDGTPDGNDSAEDPLSFCFDPVDSSCITLSNCGVWGGTVGFRVCDAIEHCEIANVEFWVLDVAGPDTTLITSPTFGQFITPEMNNVLTARKLSASGVDSVQFWRNTAQAGNGSVYIGSAVASGDEFSYEWNVEGIEGNFYLFTKSFDEGVGKDGPRCVNVTVTEGCEALALMPAAPSYSRTVNGQVINFVGDRVDLCIDRASITATAGIDSVVWYFRQASAPGVFESDNDDPFAGWVRIASDRFGSLCVDWWTDWCQYGDSYGDGYYDWLDNEGWSDTSYNSDCCSDGRFTVVAYVFDKAGNICHSVPTTLNIDNTEPYSEVVDIDGDETFGDCHEVVLTGDSASSIIKISANAIDLTCSEGQPNAAYASGAQYLQFFAGGCGSSGSSPLDILFVVDGSNSMRNQYYQYYSNNNINTLAAAASTFTSALSDRNVQYGVVGFSGEIEHDDCEANLAGQVMNTDGDPTEMCDGIWTANGGDLSSMFFGVGNIELPYVGGQTDNNYEFGLQAIKNGLDWYDWRPGAARIIVLITDEDDDPTALGFPNIDLSQIEQSGATVYTILNSTATTGYLSLAANTGGQMYDWNSNLGSTFGAITSSILSGSNYNSGDVGIVWGDQVELTDGQDNAYALWNMSGLPAGEYCVWTKVIDQIGNVYESERVSVCIEDRTPPTAYIAGFGKSTDEHMNHEYTIYGQSWDLDIDYVQFQYRPAGSTNAADWTGIGSPVAVGCHSDNTLWMTKWNPCVLSGSFQMRVVPTDENGNQDHDIQPIAHVTINNCDVTPAAASSSATAVWFEDKTFEDLGLVHVDLAQAATTYHNSMIAVWSDLRGDIESECIDLYAPDPDQATWLSGSFNAIGSIKLGGEGWFWQAYTDNANVTHLEKEVVTVWPVRADIGGCNSTHPTLGAKVCIEAGALSSDNGIIVFPARVPVVNWSQQHYQAWPAATSLRFPLVTAIRLTNPIDAEEGYYGDFNLGKYAKVTIKYREPALDNSDLTVGWWDGDQWNIEDGLLAAEGITDSSGSVYTTELHGLYSIVSAGRQCIAGALTVENAGMEKAVGNITGPWPTIFTRVRSNIEFNNGNYDIDEDNIVVVLDGNNTLYSNGSESDWYDVWYDNTSGILTVDWYGPDECLTDDDYDSYGDDGGGDSYFGEFAPALTAGTHTLYVQAFNDAGYCAENTFTFTVDRSSPDVEVVGYEDCANPTFHIKITDEGSAGVDWENVFVDVFDVTGSEFDALPKSRLIHTETYDAFNENLDMETGEFSFQLISHIAQGRRLRIVIYIGDRYVYFNNECSCEYVEYDHDCNGVQDLVGNRTQIVEEQYTIWGNFCDDSTGGDGDVVIDPTGGSGNPFDPWNGGVVRFDLRGLDGRGPVSAEVFDVAGVEVRDLHPGDQAGTVGSVEWNGTNSDAEYVAQGVYLIHFSAPGGQAGGPFSKVFKVVVKRGSGSASN